MKIQLTWKSTNDILLFDAINCDLANWFVQTSQRLGNNYAVADIVTDGPRRSNGTEQLIQEISHAIQSVNKFLASMKQHTIKIPDNWCDQSQLNTLHKEWAHTRTLWPRLPNMLYKLDPVLFDNYQITNCHTHLIEKSFRYEFRDPTHWRVDNPFKDQQYDWETSHLWICYPGHGRSAFEKFENLDEDPNDIHIDNCNWDNIDAYVGIGLSRPYKQTPPPEFLSWCQDKNLVPHTHTIALANLTDWRSNLTQARTIFMNNIKIPNNYFSLEATQ